MNPLGTFPRVFPEIPREHIVVGKKRVFPGICLRFTRVAILVDGHPMRDFWVFFRVPPARTNTDILLAADSPGLPQEIPTFSHFSRDSPGVPRGFPRNPPHFHIFPRIPQGFPRDSPENPNIFTFFPKVPQGFPGDSPGNLLHHKPDPENCTKWCFFHLYSKHGHTSNSFGSKYI